MTKKLLAFLVLVVLVWAYPNPAQAQAMVGYMGGRLIISADSTHSIGGGTVGGFGTYISDRVIIWTEAVNDKNHDADQYDYYLAGTTILSPNLIPKIRLGWFLTTTAGFGGLEDDKVQFATKTTLGAYTVLDEVNKINLYLGGGYSYVEGFGSYSFQIGISRKL